MRVGIIAPPWISVPPLAYGGTEVVVDEVARGLQACGHDVVLFTTGDSTCPVERRWVHPRALGTEADFLGEFAHTRAAYRELRGCRPDSRSHAARASLGEGRRRCRYPS